MSVNFDDRVREAEEALRARRGSAVKDRTSERRRNNGNLTWDNELELMRVVKQAVSDEARALRDDMNEVIENVLNSVREQRIVLEQPNEVERQLEGLTHCQFNDLVRMANVRDWKGHRKNILLKGPMGGGKTTAGEKLAELLGLHFGYIGQTNMPHIVVGSKRPLDDQYNHTPFTRIFRDGGVIMLEEMDAWNPNASLVLNPPLANGLLILEDGTEIKRHPDCIIIACANTWGTGATTEYVGRNKLDAAFLDRFAFKVMWSYDEELERAAANNEEVVDAVQRARFNADYNGIKVSISPRCSIDIADMVRGGFTIYEAMKMNFLASVDSNTESKLLDGVDL